MSKKATILLVLAVSAALVISVLPGCGGDEGETKGIDPSKAPIKIGVVVSESGPNESLGQPERNAIKLFAKRLNAKGGIGGHEVQVFYRDDASDSSRAYQAAVELIEQEGVIALVGSSGTGPSISIKQEATKAKVPMVCLAAGATIMEGDCTWIFRVAPTASEAGNRTLQYISKILGANKVALLYDTNAFGTDGKAVVESNAEDYGIEIVKTEGYATDDTEAAMDTHLSNAMIANPEVILVWGTSVGSGKIAKRMRDKRISIPYVGSHGIANQEFITQAGEAAEGVAFPAGKLLVFEQALEPGTAEYEFIKEFSDAYFDEYGEQISTFAGHGWDSMLIITEALKRVGPNATPAQLRDEIEKTTGLVAADGIFNYSPTDHNGLSPEDIAMVAIEGGNWVLAEQP